MKATAHSLHSSRETLIEHLFVGELLRHLWSTGPILAEVLKPQVDDAGYDLVIQVGCVLRHIQLKASHGNSSTSEQNVHLKLAEKQRGCVIWVIFDQETIKLEPYLWFGGAPDERLPDISNFKVGRHSKGDSKGRKAERPMVRVVPKGKFKKLEAISQVADELFGMETRREEKE